jgi:toxin YoeB
MYKISLSIQAEKDLLSLKKSEPSAYKKALELIKELALHPKTGTGRPELKKYDLMGLYARKVTQKHRLVYSIDDHILTVFVISAKGHYDDK